MWRTRLAAYASCPRRHARWGEDTVCDDRRVLVQVSLRQEEQVLLRRLAEAAGLEPAVLAHGVLMEGLRHLQEAYGGVDALPLLDDSSQGPWYAEARFVHIDMAG
jgi:hypothetical protein